MRTTLIFTTAIGLASSVLSAVLPNIRVTNGTLSPQGQAPFLIQLLINEGGDHYGRCGGTIIDETTIITAGHCVYDGTTRSTHPPDKILVIYGSVQTFDGTYIRATKVDVHPKYNYDGKLHNDIAIIQVPKMKFKKGYAESITVFNGDIQPHDEMAIFGWGKTRTGGSSEDSPTALLTQNVFVGEPENCMEIDPTYQNANGSLICVDNNYNVGIDVCQGDSGTGTTITLGSKTYFAGLVSYGRDKYYNPTCGESGSFGMYTRTSYYIGWIESVIGHVVSARPLEVKPTPPSTTCIFFICF
ncbi:hypothetical protein EV175_006481 [Coemansia sp. RSA 1933]|nr:hypothetical protein EV175_006481 [Coemansia sp. RSA 1933]